MRVLLVTMPWAAVHYPSLAVGVLKEAATDAKHDHDVHDMYANLMWLDYCMEKDPDLGVQAYLGVSEEGFTVGLGEWVFSRVLNREPMPADAAEYLTRAEASGARADLARRYEGFADDFINQLADKILAAEYQVVGFTSTFSQNVASLALARRLRELRPDLVTLVGGANCDGPQGESLFRNFDFLNIVVRGEGERALPDILDYVDAGDWDLLSSIPGLCYRHETVSHVNPQAVPLVPIAKVPEPNFTTYFEYLRNSELAHHIEPSLVVESSRGCWWGEKHHCTFCGLNGSTMKFRSHEPASFVHMLTNLVAKYQTLDVVMADNILDMNYFNTVLPELAKLGWDLRVHYEVKANLREEHIRALAESRVNHVQPGIENLSSNVLQIMRKGVTGPQNIRVLRDAEEYGVTVDWNYLYGFPGEVNSDYESVLGQIPALYHLQPPKGCGRIELERFSPNFDDPELGFPERTPAWFYRYIYQLDDRELDDLVYIFDTDHAGIGPEIVNRLIKAIITWGESYPESSLLWHDHGDEIVIEDRRSGWTPRRILLSPAEAEIFRTLLTVRGIGAVARTAPADLVDHWCELGLLFRDNERLIALPTRADRIPWKI